MKSSWAPTAHLMAMYHNAHGQKCKYTDFMPQFQELPKTDGPGLDVYESFMRAAVKNGA